MARLPKFLYLQAKEKITPCSVRRIPLAQAGRINLDDWEQISRVDYVLLLREYHQRKRSLCPPTPSRLS